jgi:hypothetical protein
VNEEAPGPLGGCYAENKIKARIRKRVCWVEPFPAPTITNAINKGGCPFHAIFCLVECAMEEIINV